MTVAQFLSVASTSIVAVALPSLGEDLHATGTQQQWVVDLFVLVLASMLVTGGAISDRYGGRRVFVAGMLAFGTGGLLCATAPSISWLLAGRALQALGPALLVPASLAIVTALYDDGALRLRAVATWSLGSGIGLASGPLIGGLLVSVLGWRAVFWQAAVAAAVLILAAYRTMPAPAPADPSRRIDLVSSALLMAATGLVVSALIEGRNAGWSSPEIVGLIAAGLVAGGIFARRQLRRPDPLIDVALVTNRLALATNAGGAALFGAFTSAVVFLSVYLQHIQGRSPLGAGLCMLPLGAVSAPVGQVAARFAARVGPRLPMVLGLAAACGACVRLAALEPGSSTTAVVLTTAMFGLGTGLALPSMTVTAVSAAPVGAAGMAAALHQTSRQLGQTFAVALLGTVIYSSAAIDDDLRLLREPAAAAAWVHGLNDAGWIAAAVLAAVAVLVAILLRPLDKPLPPRAALVSVPGRRHHTSV